MKHLIYSIMVIASFLALTSCVEEFKASVSSDYENMLVVEGEIREGTSTFYLSQNFSLDETSLPENYNDISATLVVIGDNGYRSLPAENIAKGVFEVQVDELEENVAYGIEIIYNGDTYQSNLSQPLYTPVIDKFEFVQPVEKEDVYIQVSTHSDSGEPQYFLWDYKEDWEFSASFYVAYFWTPEGAYHDYSGPEYYCWRKVDNKEILISSTESLKENKIIDLRLYSIESTDERLSLLYSTILTQRAISKSAYEYYQNKIKVNKEMGGLFTPQPSDIGGNITCITNPSKKVIGYVEAIKNIQQKRIFIKRDEISRPNRTSGCNVVPDSERAEQQLSYEDFYNMGYRMISEPGMGPPEWALGPCAYCTLNGGSKEKPDFWPNNHQ